MKIIFFTYWGASLPVARKLLDEGNTVLVGQVQDISELQIDKEEDPEDKKNRLSLYDGMIDKEPAQDLLKRMADFDDKDEWGVVCDFNNLFAIADQAKAAGFGEGTGFYFLPTKEQFLLESDRNSGKDFISENYDGLKVGEKHDFKTIDEGITFLQEAADKNQIYVLKSNNEEQNAIVPSSSDPQLAEDELISALASERAGYESQGYILEEKISEPMEITPQVVFYNGDPVFYDIDIETKPLMPGDTGPQTGCGSNLIFGISEFDPIIDLAFPPIVYQMAYQHKGLFIWDASILIDRCTGDKYFGEFCSNRWGYDAFYTELAMCENVTSYFEKVMQGENPLVKKFGAGVRMFNIKNTPDIAVVHEDTDNVWLMDVKQSKQSVVTAGYCWDLLCATGAGDDIDEAVDNCYDAMTSLAVTGGGYRPKFDFLSQDYPTSILSRYNDNVGTVFEGEKYTGTSIDERVRSLEKSIEKVTRDAESKEKASKRKFEELKKQMIEALKDDEEG